MAKPKAKKKGKNTKAPRKPQALPRSVQSLLKYLGGTDVKLGRAGGGDRPATLAPTSINIAVSQQQAQQQSQAQQSVRARVAPKGQIIGQSPLSAIIQQPVIVQQAPASSAAETERKFQAQEKLSEVKQNEINRKFGLLETSQKDFERAAIGAYQDVKRIMSLRIAGDANIFDARNLAARFTSRPVVEEQQFADMSFGEPITARGISEPGVFRGSVEEEGSSGLGEFLGGQYIQNVSNPEMTPVVRGRGRPRKDVTGAQSRAPQKSKKATTKIPAADVSSLLEQRAGGFADMPGGDPSALFRPRNKIIIKKKPVSTTGAPDMATQIAMMTGGGAMSPPQSTGRTIADLLGASRK